MKGVSHCFFPSFFSSTGNDDDPGYDGEHREGLKLLLLLGNEIRKPGGRNVLILSGHGQMTKCHFLTSIYYTKPSAITGVESEFLC